MFKEENINFNGIRIAIFEKDLEVGHAYLYFLVNDLHKKPFCFLEDVFIKEEYRKKGFGKKLVKKAIKVAKENNSYKIIGTSRYAREKVHSFYEEIGFLDYGKEFRLNLE